MTDTPPYTAIWHATGKRMAAQRPTAVLQADDAVSLARLPAQLDELLRPGQQAIGLIGYGPDYESDTDAAVVQIFDRANVREIPADKPAMLTDQPFVLGTPFGSDMDQASYMAAVQRIHHYLQAGDCYQVNLARRFSAHFSGDPLAAWQALAQQHPAPPSGRPRRSQDEEEGLLLLRRAGGVHRLQGCPDADREHSRAGQDPAPPALGRLRASSAQVADRDQARPAGGPDSVCDRLARLRLASRAFLRAPLRGG